MKLLTQLLLPCLFILTCDSNSYSEQDCLICELQGDWIGTEDEEVMIIYQDKIVEGPPWLIKYFEPFHLNGKTMAIDSIRFRKNETIKKYKYGVRYEVDYITNDTLKLIKYSVSDTTDRQELILQRLKPLYQYDFNKLSISSSPCYGSCPVFQLEIDSIGSVKFQGGIFTDRKGNYRGKLGEDDLDLVQSQVDKIHWEKVEKTYWSGVSDSQYFNVEMEDKSRKTYFVTTNSPELKAINLLIFRTFKVVEKNNFQKVDELLKFTTGLKHNREK